MKSLIPEPIRKMSKIELITFDLDDTFWDIRSTIINAENNSRKWTENRIGEKIDWGTFEDFMKIRSELVREDLTLEYDLGMLRKKTIAHHTKKFFNDPNALNKFIEENSKDFEAIANAIGFILTLAVKGFASAVRGVGKAVNFLRTTYEDLIHLLNKIPFVNIEIGKTQDKINIGAGVYQHIIENTNSALKETNKSLVQVKDNFTKNKFLIFSEFTCSGL